MAFSPWVLRCQIRELPPSEMVKIKITEGQLCPALLSIIPGAEMGFLYSGVRQGWDHLVRTVFGVQ